MVRARAKPRLVIVAAMLLVALPSIAQVQWDSTVNGESWVPGLTVDVEMGDTVQLADTFTNNSGSPIVVNLDHTFVPTEAVYVAHVATGGTVNQPTGHVAWSINIGDGQSATLTVWYTIAQCNWPSSTIERLWVENSERRDVTLDKWLHDLQIDSGYDPLIFSGQPATFEIYGGNNGGYENDVSLWCAFPPEAPFDGSMPAADHVDPSGSNARWDLGDLANGDAGHIAVTTMIEAGLPPDTPIEISCRIHDHVDDPVAETLISLLTVDELAIFEDGFESGDTSMWSDTVP